MDEMICVVSPVLNQPLTMQHPNLKKGPFRYRNDSIYPAGEA